MLARNIRKNNLAALLRQEWHSDGRTKQYQPWLASLCELLQIVCKAEADRLIFEDADPETGFLLHPDLKWVSIPEISLCPLAPVCPEFVEVFSCLQVHNITLHIIGGGKT